MKKLSGINLNPPESRDVTLFAGTDQEATLTLTPPPALQVMNLFGEAAVKQGEGKAGGDVLSTMLARAVAICLPEEELTDEQAARLLLISGGIGSELASAAGELTGLFGGDGLKPDPLPTGSRKRPARRSRK